MGYTLYNDYTSKLPKISKEYLNKNLLKDG